MNLYREQPIGFLDFFIVSRINKKIATVPISILLELTNLGRDKGLFQGFLDVFYLRTSQGFKLRFNR